MSTVDAKFPWQSIQALENGRVKQPRYIPLLAETLKTSQEYLQMGITAGNKPNESAIVAEILTQTITLVEQIDSDHGFKLSPNQKSKLIIYIYDEAIKSIDGKTMLEEGAIVNLVPLIKTIN